MIEIIRSDARDFIEGTLPLQYSSQLYIIFRGFSSNSKQDSGKVTNGIRLI